MVFMTDKSTHTISIALATYNGEKYLKQQLDSLLNQSIRFDELVVCDDKSNDSTIQILNEYAANDERIKIFFNDKNIGFKANFEKALRLTSGDYIALCDQDDIWCATHLEDLYNSIGNNDLICGDAQIINAEGQLQDAKLSYLTHYKMGDIEHSFFFTLLYSSPFLGMSMMCNRRFLETALPIPDSVKFHDLWFASLALSLKSMTYTDKIVTNYRFHANQVTGNYKRHPYYRSIIAHFINGHKGYYRNELIKELENRLGAEIPLSQCFNQIKRYINRENHLVGRIQNLIYELRNYKKIYGSSNQ